jgi:catechol 2,3-dioxygenase-like lactoylglutathione lyase family enzyme
MPISIERLDHFVLTVRDVEATCRFYARVLGMESRAFGDGRQALHFGAAKINLHQQGREFEPKAARPVAGSADICLIAATPLAQVTEHLQACGVDIIEGPVRRTGALGAMQSVYFRDPDGNLIEVSNYVQ